MRAAVPALPPACGDIAVPTVGDYLRRAKVAGLSWPVPESDSTTPGWSGGCFRRRRPSCTSRPWPGLERGPPGAAAQGRDALAATPWRGRRGSGSCRADPREPHSYWSRASGVSRAHRYEPDLLKAIEEERQAAGQLAVATQEVLGRLEARRPGGGGAGPRARRGPPVADRGPRCRRRVAPTAAGRGRPAVGHTRCRAGRYRRPDGRAGSSSCRPAAGPQATHPPADPTAVDSHRQTRKPALHGFRAVRPRPAQTAQRGPRSRLLRMTKDDKTTPLPCETADLADQRSGRSLALTKTDASELLNFDQGALKVLGRSTAPLDHSAVPLIGIDVLDCTKRHLLTGVRIILKVLPETLLEASVERRVQHAAKAIATESPGVDRGLEEDVDQLCAPADREGSNIRPECVRLLAQFTGLVLVPSVEVSRLAREHFGERDAIEELIYLVRAPDSAPRVDRRPCGPFRVLDENLATAFKTIANRHRPVRVAYGELRVREPALRRPPPIPDTRPRSILSARLLQEDGGAPRLVDTWRWQPGAGCRPELRGKGFRGPGLNARSLRSAASHAGGRDDLVVGNASVEPAT